VSLVAVTLISACGGFKEGFKEGYRSSQGITTTVGPSPFASASVVSNPLAPGPQKLSGVVRVMGTYGSEAVHDGDALGGACGVAEDRRDGYVAFAKGAVIRMEDQSGSAIGVGQVLYPGRLTLLDYSGVGPAKILRRSICEVGFEASVQRMPQILAVKISFQDTSTVIGQTFAAVGGLPSLDFDFEATGLRGP